MATPADQKNVEKFIEALPSPEDIRASIAANLQERQLLQRLLKLSRDRQAVSASTSALSCSLSTQPKPTEGKP